MQHISTKKVQGINHVRPLCHPCCGVFSAFRSLLFLVPLAITLSAAAFGDEAHAFYARVSPKVVRQGDVFAVTVKNVIASRVPTVTIAGKSIPVSACGDACFVGIGAVDLDAKTGKHRVVVSVGIRVKTLGVTVKRGVFRTVSMTLPEEKVILGSADRERADAEQRRLNAIFEGVSERYWAGNFLIPLDNDISTPFGTKRVMNDVWTSVHRGVDIRGADGDAVRASNGGKVVLSEELFFGGNTVILDHGQGIFTVYMHLSRARVSRGDTVSKGEVIGFVGSTGRASGPHLHFGAKVSRISVNPLSLVNLKL